MAVPKGKVSKARRDKRRSSHWKLEAPGLVACPKCGALHLPHRMCQECGTYNGREVKVVSPWCEIRRALWIGREEQHLPSFFCVLLCKNRRMSCHFAGHWV